MWWLYLIVGVVCLGLGGTAAYFILMQTQKSKVGDAKNLAATLLDEAPAVGVTVYLWWDPAQAAVVGGARGAA